MFKLGFYTNIYYSIIEKAKTRIKEPNAYYENHHIIPVSFGGSNKKDNLVSLTAREHFICHYLLTKITIDEALKRKMMWAFFMMCVDPVKGSDERKKSANYELARKIFSENHPTKNKDVVEKMKKSSIQYYQSDTYLDKRKEQVKQTLCKCGCNTIIDYYGENIPKFVNRKHYNNYQKSENAPKVTEETRNKQSKKAKENILKLTDEQRKERLKKSCLSCDQEKRGNSISKGKKDKKTNQQNIMGEKYATMTDDEFYTFINSKDRPNHIKTRMINLRNKYVRCV